jgi:polyisoprenoid-binding protein YceI
MFYVSKFKGEIHMKKQILMTIIAAALNAQNAMAQNYNINQSLSKVEWQGKKGIEMLGSHTGGVAIKEAKVDINSKGAITKASIIMDMKNISNSDLSGDLQKTLLDHLTGSDFFDAKKYPEASFVSKSIKALKNNQYELSGDLTIKGKTKAIKFIAQYSKPDNKNKLVGSFKFNRLDYGIKYGSGKFFAGLGDKMIHDEVVVNFDLVALQK